MITFTYDLDKMPLWFQAFDLALILFVLYVSIASAQRKK